MKREDVAVGVAVGAASGLLVESLGLHGAVSYWGVRAPAIVGFAVLSAVLWATRLRALVALSGAALCVLWLVVAFTPVTSWMARDLVRRDPLREADAVMVLASHIQKDGELSAPALSRLLHALELLGAGHARRLVLTELPPPSPSWA